MALCTVWLKYSWLWKYWEKQKKILFVTFKKSTSVKHLHVCSDLEPHQVAAPALPKMMRLRLRTLQNMTNTYLDMTHSGAGDPGAYSH
jgi:hypothetical protein